MAYTLQLIAFAVFAFHKLAETFFYCFEIAFSSQFAETCLFSGLTLAVKDKSVKSDQIFGKWLKFLSTNIFADFFLLPIKIFTDQYFLPTDIFYSKDFTT